jgi:CheY-like chemotaxis protein
VYFVNRRRPQLGRTTQIGLEQSGYAVDWVQSAESAHTAVRLHQCSRILLDLGLPQQDGMRALAALRHGGYDGAILIAEARDQIPDRIAGLRFRWQWPRLTRAPRCISEFVTLRPFIRTGLYDGVSAWPPRTCAGMLA